MNLLSSSSFCCSDDFFTWLFSDMIECQAPTIFTVAIFSKCPLRSKKIRGDPGVVRDSLKRAKFLWSQIQI